MKKATINVTPHQNVEPKVVESENSMANEIFVAQNASGVNVTEATDKLSSPMAVSCGTNLSQIIGLEPVEFEQALVAYSESLEEILNVLIMADDWTRIVILMRRWEKDPGFSYCGQEFSIFQEAIDEHSRVVIDLIENYPVEPDSWCDLYLKAIELGNGELMGTIMGVLDEREVSHAIRENLSIFERLEHAINFSQFEIAASLIDDDPFESEDDEYPAKNWSEYLYRKFPMEVIDEISKHYKLDSLVILNIGFRELSCGDFIKLFERLKHTGISEQQLVIHFSDLDVLQYVAKIIDLKAVVWDEMNLLTKNANSTVDIVNFLMDQGISPIEPLGETEAAVFTMARHLRYDLLDLVRARDFEIPERCNILIQRKLSKRAKKAV